MSRATEQAADYVVGTQVGAVLMRELPNLLKVAPGDFYAPGMGDVAAQNVGKAKAFGRELDARHEKTIRALAEIAA